MAAHRPAILLEGQRLDLLHHAKDRTGLPAANALAHAADERRRPLRGDLARVGDGQQLAEAFVLLPRLAEHEIRRAKLEADSLEKRLAGEVFIVETLPDELPRFKAANDRVFQPKGADPEDRAKLAI